MRTKSNAAPVRANVLMIEDNEGDIELARIAFETLDCEIVFLRSAAEALDYLHKMPLPDLILLDLNMPSMRAKEWIWQSMQEIFLPAMSA